MSSGPAADSPARSPVASPAAVAVARKRVYTRLQYTRLQYTRLQYTRLQFTVHAFTVHAFTVHAFTAHAFTAHAFTVYIHAFTVHAFTVHAFTVHAFTVHAFTVQGDEFNEIHGEKFTASEELCPRDQRQIRRAKSRTQRPPLRHRARAAMSSGPAADSPAQSPVASPAAVAVARKRVYTRLQYTRLQYTRLQYTRLQFTVHAFTVHAFTVHAFTVYIHAFTVHAFTVHAFTFTVHAFTVHAFTVHAFTVHAFTVQGDEFNEIHGEKFTASEELCPRDQRQIRPRKVPYVASPAATASETNPVRIPGHKDWTWAGGGHSQRRSSRCPVASPAAVAVARKRVYTRLQYTRLQYTRLQYTRLQFTVHAFTVHAFTVHAFTAHAFTFTVHAFTVHAFTVHAFTVQGDEFNEIHGEKFTASEELCPRDQRQIRPRKVPYAASPAATASETNPVRIPGHKDWAWAGGGHSQRRSSRCHRVRAAMSSGPAADSPARSPVASPAAVAVALHAFTVHAFTAHAFTAHAFTVYIHAFTVHAFTVHAFTVHAFTVHAFTVPAFTVHAFIRTLKTGGTSAHLEDCTLKPPPEVRRFRRNVRSKPEERPLTWRSVRSNRRLKCADFGGMTVRSNRRLRSAPILEECTLKTGGTSAHLEECTLKPPTEKCADFGGMYAQNRRNVRSPGGLAPISEECTLKTGGTSAHLEECTLKPPTEVCRFRRNVRSKPEERPLTWRSVRSNRRLKCADFGGMYAQNRKNVRSPGGVYAQTAAVRSVPISEECTLKTGGTSAHLEDCTLKPPPEKCADFGGMYAQNRRNVRSPGGVYAQTAAVRSVPISGPASRPRRQSNGLRHAAPYNTLDGQIAASRSRLPPSVLADFSHSVPDYFIPAVLDGCVVRRTCGKEPYGRQGRATAAAAGSGGSRAPRKRGGAGRSARPNFGGDFRVVF
ncbi:hypothetical protein Bbelb_022690 [Branchiostoma belcheri]|nr:hypothetical protein Bbelb_022690 [Branchiostoma belcheri]